MDIERLMSEDGMRAFTAKCRDRHQQADTQYGQLGEIVQRRLQQERKDGDRFFHARLRAWKVKRQFKRLARLSRKSAGVAEAVNASYKKNVLEVDGNRAQKALNKAQRKQGAAAATSGFVSASLTKSADAFNGLSAQVTGVQEQQPVAYLDAEPTMKMAAGGGIETAPTGTVYDHFGGRR